MTAFVVISSTIIIFFLSGLLPGPREWRRSAFRKPAMAFLILAALLSVFLGQPRGVHAIIASPVDSVRLVRIVFLTVLTIISVIGVIRNLGKKISSGPGIKWMLGYGVFAMFSAVYSSIPLLTLWKGFEVLAMACVGLYIGIKIRSEDDLQDVINIILLGLWLIIISALVGATVVPSEAFTKMQSREKMAFALQGVYPFVNANTLSQISGMIAACALAWMVKPKRTYGITGPLIIFLTSITCLILAHSRTSIIAFLLTTALLMFVFRKRVLLFGVLWLGAILALSGTVMQYFLPYFIRGQKTAVLTSLSGRTTFWPEVIKKIGDAPFLGSGFYASQRIIWDISSVDNTYLETILGLGIIGAILLCVPVLSIASNLWTTRPWKTGLTLTIPSRFIWMQLCIFFIFLFVRSLTGPSFQNLHINLVIFVILLVASFRLQIMFTQKRMETTGSNAGL